MVNDINAGNTTIDGGLLTANTVSATQIAANTVTTNEIKTDTILLNDININQLFTDSDVDRIYTTSTGSSLTLTTESVILYPREKATLNLIFSTLGTSYENSSISYSESINQDPDITSEFYHSSGTHTGIALFVPTFIVVKVFNNSYTTNRSFSVSGHQSNSNFDLTGCVLTYNVIRMRR